MKLTHSIPVGGTHMIVMSEEYSVKPGESHYIEYVSFDKVRPLRQLAIGDLETAAKEARSIAKEMRKMFQARSLSSSSGQPDTHESLPPQKPNAD